VKRERKSSRRETSTRLQGVVSDYSKKSSSKSHKRPRKGIALQVKISDFSSFDSALRVFSAMTLDIVREAKERHYYRPKMSRRNRKRRGKAIEKRNQERGYINDELY